jgi:HAE1 family hydrophobic/amphiphilic exporter-1
MKSISEFSIRKPATAFMVIISMIFFGIYGLLKMPIEMIPNTANPSVDIKIEWKGATPEDVEKMITKKIEDVLPNVKGITEYTSVSESEKSTIKAKFDYGTDTDTKITLIQNEINQIKGKLPTDIEEPVIRSRSTTSIPVIVAALSGGDEMEMRSYAQNTLKPMVERINGVSKVEIFGGKEQEILVEIDPQKLENYNLGILDVKNILAQATTTIPGGQVREGEKQYFVKIEGELESAEEIGDIIIKNENGHLLRLNEIADVRIDTKDISRYFRKDKKTGIMMAVIKADEGNSVEIVKKVSSIVDSLKGSIPLGSTIEYEFDSSVSIMNSIMNVKDTAVIGLVLAAIILFIFLKSVTSTFIITMAIPISIIFTFFFLNIQGISLNLISLMGLSLGIGMLVDNSVVVIDNIFRHRTELGKNKFDAAKDGAQEMALPILASTLTTVSVFLPIVFQEGMAKEQFKDFSYAISYSLMASLIVALVFVPMASSKIMNGNVKVNSEGKMMKVLKNAYVGILKASLKYRYQTLIGIVALFFASLFVGSKLKVNFMPKTDEGRFAVIAQLPSSADVNMSDRIAQILEEKAPKVPEIQTYTVFGDTSTTTLNMNAGLKTSRKSSLNDIMGKLRKEFDYIPDVQLTITPNFAMGTDGIYDVEFDLYSNNENQLREISDMMKEKMASISDLTDIKSSFEGGKPEGRIVIDREKAKYYGVNVASLASMINIQILGNAPITINSDNDEIDVTVQLAKRYRESTNLLMDTRITLNNGKNVKLSDVAKLEIVEGPSKIEKKDKIRRITLYANLKEGGNLQGAKNAIVNSFKELGIPDGVTYGFGGDSADMASMGQQIGIAMGIGIFLIYFILVWQFESFILPFIILLSIPLSTIGAIVGMFIFQIPLDMMGAVGFVMLAGIVVNNAIVLIDFINERRTSGDGINRAIIVSGKTRLRPILMTTLTTVLGMVPLAVSKGEGAENYTSMAYVVIFGLTSATLLTLVVIPLLYYAIEDMKNGIKGALNGRVLFNRRSIKGNKNSNLDSEVL